MMLQFYFCWTIFFEKRLTKIIKIFSCMFYLLIALSFFFYFFDGTLVLKEKREVDIAIFSELCRKLASQVRIHVLFLTNKSS